MATHFSILAWRNPWTEEPGGYSPWDHRLRHHWATNTIIAAEQLYQKDKKFKKKKMKSLARMWRKRNTVAKNVNWYSYCGKWNVISFKNITKITIWSSNLTSGYKSKANKISISKRYLHSCVHCSIIHKSKDMKTTSVLSNKRTHKYTECIYQE